jgi:hypothetical protein
MASEFEMYQNVIPLTAPYDATVGTIASPYINMGTFHRGTIFVYFGNVDADTAADSITITLEASSASTSDASEEAVPFEYRVSAAFATGNTWGAVTACTSAGLAITPDNFDGFMYGIDVNPSRIVGHMPQAKYVRLQLTADSAYTNLLTTVFAIVEPRYRQTTMVVATVT